MAETRFLPKRIISQIDNHATYPSISRSTGKKSIESNSSIYFDDSKTIIYSESIINYPTTFNNNLNFSIQPQDFYKTELSASGNTIPSLIDQWVFKNIIDETQISITPFKEENIDDNIIFESGNYNFPSPFSSKTCITIKLPIPEQNFLTGSYNRTLNLAPSLKSSIYQPFAGWYSTNSYVLSRSLNMDNAGRFDVLGNYTNSNLSGQNYINFNDALESIKIPLYTREQYQLPDFSKIQLKDYINHPFAIEKVSIEFYGKATQPWLDSVTALTSSDNSFLIGGSAITVGLHAINNGYSSLVFSGTIVSPNDVISQNENSYDGSETIVFPKGFTRWATPNFIFPNSTDLTKITVQGDCGISNGFIQFVLENNPTSSLSPLDGKIYSNTKLGRSKNGFSSGRSLFANEYVLPEKSISKFNTSTATTGIFYSHLHNSYKSISSPYVIFPNEHLSLTISKYLPVPIAGTSDFPDDRFYIGGNTPPYNAVKGGYEYYDLNETNYITIKLYGSLLLDQKEKFDLSNSSATTNSIHECLDNSTLTDQFNCNSYDMNSGGILSHVRVPYRNGTHNRESFVRVLNSYVNNYDTNLGYKQDLASDWDTYIFHYKSLVYRNFREIAPRKKTIETISNNEYYLDSIPPSIQDIFKLNGKQIAKFNCESVRSAIILKSLYNKTYDTSKFTNLEEYCLNGWTSSFPFAGINENAVRLFKLDSLNVTGSIIFRESNKNYTFENKVNGKIENDTSIIIINDDLPITTSNRFENCYADISSFTLPAFPTPIQNSIAVGLSKLDFAKILFGFSRSPGVLDYPNYRGEELADLFWDTGTPSITKANIKMYPEIRGWKYGLIHGVPMPTKCHWNPKHYGHFRDLFEQRHFTAFYYDERSNENINKSFSKIMENAIFIKFVDSKTNEPIEPSDTTSANVSIYSASTMPFFDNLSVDRN